MACGRIEKWLQSHIEGKFVYVFLGGIWVKRCWARGVKKVSVLVAVGVDSLDYSQVKGVKAPKKIKKAGRDFYGILGP